ncbi:branched-chain amino acid transport system ATP-binding protein [Variovorax boronicumulans]|uniref:ATP-binding cassette domain-containing protein n=1 Tax=Variovorax boronicumulans TaxID=436515 RepID=UPI002789D40F|nr:ATP-binding cassette domain-containing protein [Variovorax boronicumulans]MDQ0083136.1 branched-chain amino acid transport system ATP-binding protein [Variovorax boronicumulans]
MTLVFNELVCGYGDTVVVRGVSGEVRPGHALAIVGRNGVGKSTLLKALAGQLPLTSGYIDWNGQALGDKPLHARLGLGIAFAPQENVVFGELTVADNLWLHLDDRKADRYEEVFKHFPLLQRRLDQRAGSLSGGERKLLSFARTMGLKAKLAMLDEPTEGVQPENIDRMAAMVNRRKTCGDSFIIVEQNLEFVAAFADTVLVLDHGEVVLQGSFAALGRERIEQHMVV